MRISPRIRHCLEAAALPTILLAAFFTRFIMAITTFTSTIDTSTVGIMGIRILEGDRPLFYYGQNYMGALEGYGTALMFRLFGVSTTTLTLTPTLFAVGWAAAMYLVFKRLFCRWAGIAAALCVAIPGWYTIWYTMGSYGGYPETYLFGTLAIWVCLRFTDPDTPDFSFGNSLLLGILLALGVWTNLQVIPFFLVAALIAGVHWLCVNRSFMRLLSLATGGALGLVGLLPGYLVTRGTEDPGLVEAPTLARVPRNFEIMLNSILPRLLWWKSTDVFLLKWIVAIVVLLPVLFYLISLIRKNPQPIRFIPLLFAAIFLSLYLPHSMASLGAPRYMISLSIIVFSAGFASMLCSEKRALRIGGWALLALWTTYNGVSIAHKCISSVDEKHKKVAARMDLVNTARARGLKNIMIVGSPTAGLRGLILSLYSRCEISFVSSGADRVYQHSDAWENDDRGAFTFTPGATPFVTGSLKAMGVSEYEITDTAKYVLLDGIRPVFSDRRAIGGATVLDMRGFAGETNAITDRNAKTRISTETSRNSSFTIDLGSRKTVDGVRFFGVDDDLPRGPYSVSISPGGDVYTPVQEVNRRTAQSYQCGNRIYFKGRFAAQDCRFAPAEARYLRLDYEAKPGRASSWNISEIIVFEHLSKVGPVMENEIQALVAKIKTSGVAFTYCDRWLSRKLEPLLGSAESGHAVFPTHNTRYPRSELSREIAVGPNRAIAVDSSMAEQATSLVVAHLPNGMQTTSERLGRYTLLTFTCVETTEPVALPLVWNGHTVLSK